MFADFQREYAELSDDELLQVASDRQSLSDNAKSALDAEIRNRNLTAADLAQAPTFREEEQATRNGKEKQNIVRKSGQSDGVGTIGALGPTRNFGHSDCRNVARHAIVSAF